MQDSITWNLLSRHLAKDESKEEKAEFQDWFNQSEKNKAYFYQVEGLWNHSEIMDDEFSKMKASWAFREKFSFLRIKKFILQQALGNLVGFSVGMWVTTTFSHSVLERKNIKNLFGIMKRKDVTVNDIPHWLQVGISILVGFIVLELINYFFQTKQYLILWKYIRGNKQAGS
ncbi:MAG TPA: hypothetical protein VGK10_15035 [Prolixibacteraceae bacterium]|jgi:ferric-dicitrate binding protein FerR (iron transport regulator)